MTTGCNQTVAIVGAGLLGRLLAMALNEQGYRITIFDRDAPDGRNSCGYMGAGLLAPISELEMAESLIAALGFDSLVLWPGLLQSLASPVFFQQAGTLLVAHPFDRSEISRFTQTVGNKLRDSLSNDPGFLDGFSRPLSSEFPQNKLGTQNGLQRVDSPDIQALEPELSDRFQQGVFIPGEGQLDNRQLMLALRETLDSRAINRPSVCWQANREIRDIKPHRVDGQSFDWVLDCRGLGARPAWPGLRGVRGEIIRVHAPDISLMRPVRLMHPRYPLYIAPRQLGHYVIGATSLESDDTKPMTVQSALELLSAAFAVHPGFAEATILEMGVQCRPALPTHLPQIQTQPGLVRINGLYRHGFLISPKLVDLVIRFLAEEPIEEKFRCLFVSSEASAGARQIRLKSQAISRENPAYAAAY
jgi:glycine oxidase